MPATKLEKKLIETVAKWRSLPTKTPERKDLDRTIGFLHRAIEKERQVRAGNQFGLKGLEEFHAKQKAFTETYLKSLQDETRTKEEIDRSVY